MDSAAVCLISDAIVMASVLFVLAILGTVLAVRLIPVVLLVSLAVLLSGQKVNRSMQRKPA